MATSSLVSLTQGLLAYWKAAAVAFPTAEPLTVSIASSIDDLDDLINFVQRAQAEEYAVANPGVPMAVKPAVIPFIALVRDDIDRMPGGGRNNRGFDLLLDSDVHGATLVPVVPMAATYSCKFVARTFAECENWIEFMFINYGGVSVNFEYPLDMMSAGQQVTLSAMLAVDEKNSKATPYSEDDRQLYSVSFGMRLDGFLVGATTATLKRFSTINLDLRVQNTGGTVTEFDELAVITSTTPPNPLP